MLFYTIWYICLLAVCVMQIRANIYWEKCYLKYDRPSKPDNSYIQLNNDMEVGYEGTQVSLDEKYLTSHRKCVSATYSVHTSEMRLRTEDLPNDKCSEFIYSNETLILLNTRSIIADETSSPNEPNVQNSEINNNGILCYDGTGFKIENTCTYKLLLDCRAGEGLMWNETKSKRQYWDLCYLQFIGTTFDEKRIYEEETTGGELVTAIRGTLISLDQRLDILKTIDKKCVQRSGGTDLNAVSPSGDECTRFKYYNSTLTALYTGNDHYIVCTDGTNTLKLQRDPCKFQLEIVCEDKVTATPTTSETTTLSLTSTEEERESTPTTTTQIRLGTTLPSQSTTQSIGKQPLTTLSETQESTTLEIVATSPTSKTVNTQPASTSTTQTEINSESATTIRSGKTTHVQTENTQRGTVNKATSIPLAATSLSQASSDIHGVIDQMVQSHFVTRNFYISECVMEIIQSSSVESCLERCINRKCKSFSHSLKNMCVLNSCVSENMKKFSSKPVDDQFVYYSG